MTLNSLAAIFSVFVVSPALLSNLSSCSISKSEQSVSIPKQTIETSSLWTGQLVTQNWKNQWGVRNEKDWGWDNLEIITDKSDRFEDIIRVHYPAGSASPNASRRENIPLGGSQFYADLGIQPQDVLRLSYFVRFSDNFEFVKGGKLPGLFGGEGNSGGDIPDGTDGFSTRFMWRRNGEGELYAYLPTSSDYGTSIGKGDWTFETGRWYQLEQIITLNDPEKTDGRIQVFVDGVEVVDRQNLTFRTTADLKIEGLFFSTFFGGSDSSWATPNDVYIDFADFSVSEN
ncbi:MAG: polysaccharide lyase [Geitlerinemataceae cyanobacterium]